MASSVRFSPDLSTWLAQGLEHGQTPAALVQIMVAQRMDPRVARAIVDAFVLARRSGRPVPVDSLTIEDEPDGRVVYSRNAHDERRSLTRCPSLVGRLSAPAPDCLRRPRLSSRSDTAFRPARRSTESRCA